MRELMRGWVDLFRDGGKLHRLMLAAVGLCLCLPAGPAYAGEEEDAFAAALRQSEYLAAEIDAALRELDASRYDYDADYQPLPYTFLSINRNATVTVGGEVRVNYTYSNSNLPGPIIDPDPLTRGQRGASKIGDLSLTSTHLYFDVAFGQRWRAFFDFNLQGQNQRRHTRYRYRNKGNGTGYERINMNNNLEEAYLELLKAGHSGLGVKVGQFHLPFGLKAKPDLFMQSYIQSADLTGSYLLGDNGNNGMALLPHASACLDPVMAAMLSYELRDIIRFEAALFQNADRDGDLRHTWDGRRLKSEQPRSFQVGAGIYPLEDWELSFAFRNRHSRNRGIKAWTNSPYRGDFAGARAAGSRDPRWDKDGQWSDQGNGPSFGSRHNEQSIMAGLAVEIPYTGLLVFAEYAYGWNQGFNKHIRSDDVNLGMAYRVTPRLTLHMQGEWLHVRDGSWLKLTGGGWERDVRNNRLYRFLLGGEYELLSGLTLEAGWQFEYWRYHSLAGNDGDSVTRNWRASTFYMGTRFIF